MARVVSNVDNRTLGEFMRVVLSDRVSLLSTDKSRHYPKVKGLNYGAVDHSRGHYVVGAIHTNTIEGFWSQFKRGIVGTFHKVTAKYMPLYVSEFQFRYNSRLNPDIVGAAVRTV